MKETEMYSPLKKFLEEKGYEVYSEVENIDVLAIKDDQLLIVEMKISFNLQLIFQLSERLKITDQVFAYVPLKKGGRWPKAYKKMVTVLKRLNCGLITLDQHKQEEVVIEFLPKPFTGRKNPRTKKQILKELAGRSVDLNQAGCSQEILFTAYKEKSLRIGFYLLENGPSTTKSIREALSITNSSQILQQNHYFWFDRVSRGVYSTTPEFERFKAKYQDKINVLLKHQT